MANWAIGLMSVPTEKLQKKKQKLLLQMKEKMKIIEMNLHLTLLVKLTMTISVQLMAKYFLNLLKIDELGTNNDDDMFDVKTINEALHGNSGTMKATKLGKNKVQTKQVDGTTKTVILQSLKFCANSKVNFLSITALLSQGSILAKDLKNIILVAINNKNVIIYRQSRTHYYWVFSFDIFAGTGCATFDLAQPPNTQCKRYVTVSVLHELLLYSSKATTRLMSKEMNIVVTGIFQPCKSCALERVKKNKHAKTINKQSNFSEICILLIYLHQLQ